MHATNLIGTGIRILLITVLIGPLCGCAQRISNPPASGPEIPTPRGDAPRVDESAAEATLKPFDQPVPHTTAVIRMLPIPGGSFDVAGASGGSSARTIQPFWMSATEIPWEVFDVWAYRLDLTDAERSAGVDAVSRPTKPYLPPDRGFGHKGYAAISMTAHAAQEYCRWLSARTGKQYRLPTTAEWEWAARAGSRSAYGFGESAARLGEFAWYAANSGGKPRAIGGRKANAWGLHDMLGNVSEWCIDGSGSAVASGGSYRDDARSLRCDARVPQDESWNASDPQAPKSRWWLSDCSFVGFRIVCEP